MQRCSASNLDYEEEQHETKESEHVGVEGSVVDLPDQT